jgi:para-aminobenzoate synthetase component 1
MRRLVCSVREFDLGNRAVLGMYEKLRHENSFVLHSSMPHRSLGRHSYLGFEPFLVFKSKGRNYWLNGERGRGNPMEALRGLVGEFALERKEGMPLLCGGAVGYFSYDIARFFERLPGKAKDDLGLPDAYFLFVDKVIAVDHFGRKMKLVALGESKREANEKIGEMAKKIGERQSASAMALPLQKPVEREIKSNFSKEAYIRAVERARDYIMAGDAFQVNLSQRLETETREEPFLLFERLARTNPAPFSAFLNLGGFQIASSSPERLVKVEGNHTKVVETRPIGGTRPRGRTRGEDKRLEKELLSSEKERAEHAMLVDLERNDLGRVCAFGTVKPRELFSVERYARVMHLVSEIRGELSKGKDCFDVLKAMFPGGTITGCPKVRVMEIIDELEPTARGVYTGSIGFLNFNSEMELNIAIRTIIVKENRAFLSVGGGIVADSVAEKEFEETMHKASALLAALNGWGNEQHDYCD